MHNRLEEYLDEIDRRLQHVPSWEREEWREEARQHLAALAEAHEELGSTPEQALRAAIRQFGQPAHLAQGLDTAASARSDRDASRHLAASAHTLSWFTVVTVFAMNLWVDGMHKAGVFGTWRAPFTWAAILIFWAGLGTGGAILGRLTGRTALGRFIVAAFPLLVLAAVTLTGTDASLRPLETLTLAAIVGTGLGLGSRAARWAARWSEARRKGPNPCR